MDAKAFTAFEQAAHDRIAQTYAEHFTPLPGFAVVRQTARISLISQSFTMDRFWACA